MDHLIGKRHVVCIKSGFHDVEPDTRLPMRAIVIEHRNKQTTGTRTVSVPWKEMVIELTAPDGTRHHFHPRQEDAAARAIARQQPAPNPFRPERRPPVIHYHAVAAFVEYFEVPAQSCLLDLIEAIMAAAQDAGID